MKYQFNCSEVSPFSDERRWKISSVLKDEVSFKLEKACNIFSMGAKILQS